MCGDNSGDNKGVVRDRPYFGSDQVRCVCQIRKGFKYYDKHETRDSNEIVIVTRGPFYQKIGSITSWWIECEWYSEDGSKYKRCLSLRDRNIFPYDNGTWNGSNWLAFTKENRFLANSCRNHLGCDSHSRYCYCDYHYHCHIAVTVDPTGDTAKVSSHEWVVVKNLETISSGNNSFRYGDFCSIQRGGTVTVVGIAGNRVLVRYFIDRTVHGALAPSGVVFFITKERFSEMRKEYRYCHCHRDRDCYCDCYAVAAEDAEKKLVRELLNK